jgi:hypothetical protein
MILKTRITDSTDSRSSGAQPPVPDVIIDVGSADGSYIAMVVHLLGSLSNTEEFSKRIMQLRANRI